MKRLSKILPLLVSGTFLMVSSVSADPDKHFNRGRILEQSSRDCSHNHNCRTLGARTDRHDRDDDRRSNYDDNRRSHWDRDYDNRRKPRIELRISSFPVYRDVRRRPYYGSNRVLYPAPVYVYLPRDYYREYSSTYPDPNFDYAPDGSRIIWNDSVQQNTVTPQQATQQSLGQYCREYYKDVTINGQTQQVFGTACRQADGSWEIKN